MSWPAFIARHVIKAISTLLFRAASAGRKDSRSATAPSPGPAALVMPIYQARCRESCATRAALPELRTLGSPSDVTLVGLFRLFNTFKKSMLNFRSARSLIFHVSTLLSKLRISEPTQKS